MTLKRIFDIFVSGSALLLFLPVILVVSVLVARKLGSPVVFRQKRPGYKGKIFEMYKFRSMRDAVDASGVELPDSERLTSFGERLRASSLDELPGLWNVLKGDMSLVGPRPLLVRYLPLYSEEQAKRHNVLPGITGWAQVNGRNAITWDKRFELDVWYVENRSFMLDMKILLLTVRKIFVREGISNDSHATMPFFELDAGDERESRETFR